jgi:hypothetical protein
MTTQAVLLFTLQEASRIALYGAPHPDAALRRTGGSLRTRQRDQP